MYSFVDVLSAIRNHFLSRISFAILIEVLNRPLRCGIAWNLIERCVHLRNMRMPAHRSLRPEILLLTVGVHPGTLRSSTDWVRSSNYLAGVRDPLDGLTP